MNIALPTALEPHAIDAVSIDLDLMRALQRGGFRGRVHSVFDRVINIAHADGELITLACRGVDDAPSTAILDLDGFGATGVAADDPVSGRADRLWIGARLVIVLGAAREWDRALPLYPAATGTLQANLGRLRLQTDCAGATGGRFARAGAASEFDRAVTALLEQRAANLYHALLRRDLAGACGHAISLLGLGPGLTPSGDDFLVGLFAVLNIPASPCHAWLGGGAQVLSAARRSTHAISLAALSQAARGRVRESIAALIEHLLYGAAEGLDDPLRRVLAIGSTSGADIVAGIRCGLELNISHGGCSCQSKW